MCAPNTAGESPLPAAVDFPDARNGIPPIRGPVCCYVRCSVRAELTEDTPTSVFNAPSAHRPCCDHNDDTYPSGGGAVAIADLGCLGVLHMCALRRSRIFWTFGPRTVMPRHQSDVGSDIRRQGIRAPGRCDCGSSWLRRMIQSGGDLPAQRSQEHLWASQLLRARSGRFDAPAGGT